MSQEKHEVNLLHLKPRRNAESQVDEKGTVVVLVPKFRSKFLSRWLTPLIGKQYFRVKLDGYGSFIWNQCDGTTTVAVMAEKMRGHFGTAAEPAEERIAEFLNKLERGDLIIIESTTESQS